MQGPPIRHFTPTWKNGPQKIRYRVSLYGKGPQTLWLDNVHLVRVLNDFSWVRAGPGFHPGRRVCGGRIVSTVAATDPG